MVDITHQPCPHPDCGSSDAFSYNPEKGVGKCHSCGNGYPKKGVRYTEQFLSMYPLPDGNERVKVMPEKIEGWDDPIVQEKPKPAYNGVYRGIRGLTDNTMEFFGVQSKVDSNGEVTEQRYVYPSGSCKYRILPKQFKASGNLDALFGQNLFVAGSAKKVTVTEGELDAMSVWQMLKKPNYVNPVVSLPSATPSRKFWDSVAPWLDSFEEIILSVDNDGPGKTIAEKIHNMFPGKVKMVDHGSCKDANEMLQQGKAKEFVSAWWGASPWKPDNILHTADELLKLFDETPNHTYVPTGIQAFDDKALGLMQGHFTIFKAETGIGKTELMRYLETKLIDAGVTFAAWHLEETQLRSVLGLVSYRLSEDVTRKDLVEEKGLTKEVRQSIRDIADTGTYFHYFLKEESGKDELLKQIRFLKEAYGCKYIFFEPIQDVINVSDTSAREQELSALAVSLSRIAADLNVGIVTIAHTNDDGEIKYCRMLGQRASVIVKLDRDKHADDVIDSNTTRLFLEKNRPTSLEGPAGQLLFDPESFTLKEY